MGARLDGPGGEADDLPVAAHRFSNRQGARSDLVPGRNGLPHMHALGGENLARHQRLASDQHVVPGVEADEGGTAASRTATGDDLHQATFPLVIAVSRTG
ncbi:hypothetical protein D9M68_1000290 [compost metagenome]